ncbi:hypothetical protein M427DRAFT_60817 [Gonapodya prolifera JEL478]|uniref:Golgi apparatus membrane protein TVP38 n=1 Tax=Gonapodya prolifera (strain JEL478) TaxID=1344416 RepID=A0A139A446_GONPJ|nr:hypothetical protein M427DRAFT_60817 [Gonapodya prolifera JEL478]|eukprot:KXS11245.1 hypothetical protein M427DRAFT_60817 [Gonapodya prolifera JEL478]
MPRNAQSSSDVRPTRLNLSREDVAAFDPLATSATSPERQSLSYPSLTSPAVLNSSSPLHSPHPPVSPVSPISPTAPTTRNSFSSQNRVNVNIQTRFGHASRPLDASELDDDVDSDTSLSLSLLSDTPLRPSGDRTPTERDRPRSRPGRQRVRHQENKSTYAAPAPSTPPQTLVQRIAALPSSAFSAIGRALADPLGTCRAVGWFLYDHIWNSPLFFMYAASAVSGIIVLIIIIEREVAVPYFVGLADRVHDLGGLGLLILLFAIFLACFPPVPGYGTLLALCGFIFSFPLGLIPAYFGALLGSLGCFVTSRRLFTGYGERIAKKYPGLGGVLREVERGSVGFLILVRLAPYPFSLMNVLLSTTRVPFSTYALATSVAICKNALHVYLGSTVHDLADLERTGGHPAKIAGMVGGAVIAVVVAVYLAVVVRRTLKERERESGIDGGELDVDGDPERGTRASSPIAPMSPASFSSRTSASPHGGLHADTIVGLELEDAGREEDDVEVDADGEDVADALLPTNGRTVGAGRSGGGGVLVGAMSAVRAAVTRGR